MQNTYIDTIGKLNTLYQQYDILKKTFATSQLSEQSELEGVRKNIRKQLQDFENYCHKIYAPRVAEILNFSVIAFLDEKCHLLAASKDLRWDALQSEFYDRNDAGEYFFTLADDAIENPLYPAEVYAALWLCLKHGFYGKYYDSGKVVLNRYQRQIINELKNLIPQFLENSKADTSQKGKKRSTNSVLYTLLERPVASIFIGISAIILPIFSYFYSWVTL